MSKRWFSKLIYMGMFVFIVHAQSSGFKEIQIHGNSKLSITADLYKSSNGQGKLILLFHSGYSSRGEYRQIAPRLSP